MLQPSSEGSSALEEETRFRDGSSRGMWLKHLPLHAGPEAEVLHEHLPDHHWREIDVHQVLTPIIIPAQGVSYQQCTVSGVNFTEATGSHSTDESMNWLPHRCTAS